MIIEIPREMERFGANIFYNIQKVIELESGHNGKTVDKAEMTPFYELPHDTIHEIEKQLVIVIPVKNEKLRLIEGVLFGIPHNCLTIVVSNSNRKPVNRFLMEKKLIDNIRSITKRKLVHVHQKDPLIGEALAESGYTDILDKEGVVKNGKGEGMILALILAKLTGKKYIGFIDSDNYFPGSVHEYVKEYAAGFSISESRYSMVRISWYSKPEVVKSNILFPKQGRSSIVTNRYLNKLIGYYTGFETDVIKTGNAGEHAISMDLAMVLSYSSGYAIEPYHFINLMENFGGLKKSPFPEVMSSFVEVFQVNSRNPHFHQKKGANHINSMIKDALKVVYNSFVCPRKIKREILEELRSRKVLAKTARLKKTVYYPPILNVDFDKFKKKISKGLSDVISP